MILGLILIYSTCARDMRNFATFLIIAWTVLAFHAESRLFDDLRERKFIASASLEACKYTHDGVIIKCDSRDLTIIPGNFSAETIELILSSNNISKIFPSTFKGLHKLRILDLGANFINDLAGASFKGLRHLEILHLDANRLSRVPTEALRLTPNLKLLLLAVNNIEIIDDGSFASLTKLLALDLRENRIRKIEDRGFDGLSNLRNLDLTDNQLMEYPTAVMGLTQLEEIKFDNNNITHLPDHAFVKQNKLETLTFRNNPLKSVGKWAFKYLRFVTSLYIVDVAEQKEFPDISGCESLKHLTVTGGRISRFPRNLCGEVTSLQSLTVSNNKLRHLAGLRHCRKLEKLDASGNLLTSLQRDDFKYSVNLSELYLSNNDIQRLDEDLFESMKLVKLNLAMNSFSFLPVIGLRRLRSLNISGLPQLFYLPPIELMRELQTLVATYPFHCCQFESTKVEEGKTCYPKAGSLTSCRDLLPSMMIRTFLWMTFIISSGLNGMIIAVKLLQSISGKRRGAEKIEAASSSENNTENKEKPFVAVSLSSNFVAVDVALCHLAFSDLVTSVYLGIIVNYDALTRDNFAEMGSFWQQSFRCKSAGFIYVLGVQLSFLTVVIIAVERYLTAIYPLSRKTLIGRTSMGLSFLAAWIIAIATAIVTSYSETESWNRLGRPLPPYNGATCLPWSTDFTFVAILVVAHLALSVVVIILCILTYCSRHNQPLLSAQKHIYHVALTIACNVFFVLPLALVGLLISTLVLSSFSFYPWRSFRSLNNGEFNAEKVNLLLMIILFFTSIRLLLNPILYITFNQTFWKDCKDLAQNLFCYKHHSRYHDYESDSDDVTRTIASDNYDFEEDDVPYPLQQYLLSPEMVGVDMTPEEHDQVHSLHLHGTHRGQRPIIPRQILLKKQFPSFMKCQPCFITSQTKQNAEENLNVPHIPSKASDANEMHPHLYFASSGRSQPVDHLLVQNNNMRDDDIAGPSERTTSLCSAEKNNSRVCSVPEESRGIPALVTQQFHDTCGNMNFILLQSCESSTSKDSGIQSEPDYNHAAILSNGCNKVPVFHICGMHGENDHMTSHSLHPDQENQDSIPYSGMKSFPIKTPTLHFQSPKLYESTDEDSEIFLETGL